MKSFILVAAIVAALVACIDAADYCNQFNSCASCIGGSHQGICGWCSQPTTEGFKCAGLSKNGQKNNFTCPAVFSTETCEIGYECNQANLTCVPTAPGGGTSLATCQSNCSNTGKTFVCDNTTWSCKIAPAGQGTALQICDASCKNPADTTTAPATTETHETASHSPASHSPASHSPASNSPHSSEAPSTSATADLYKCDPASASCVPATPGTGTSLMVCQQQCKQSNNTPANLLGLWRAFPISNGDFTPLEFDFNFMNSQGDCQYTHTVGSVLSGKATFLDQSFSMTLSDNSQISCLYTQQNTQPTTYEMIFSCLAGPKPPQSMDDAMAATSGAFVVLASRCVDPTICKFVMQAGPTKGSLRREAKKSIFRTIADNQEAKKQQQQKKRRLVNVETINDSCMQYGKSCTICLREPNCGWCSVTVDYNVSGQVVPGTQCAGFASAGHTPWKCDADFSTDQCVPGYACNATTQQCVSVQPGDGNPSLQSCEAGCKAKPGPPSNLIGKYRGILINQNYQGEAGVFRLELTATGLKETLPDGTQLTGTIKNYAQYMFVQIAGQTGEIACVYSPNSATEGVVEYVTFACSQAGKAAPSGPQSFDNMMSQGAETVFAKCLSSDCKW